MVAQASKHQIRLRSSVVDRNDKTYLAISFLSLLVTMGEMICCSWFTTLQACRTLALWLRARIARALNTFSFSAST